MAKNEGRELALADWVIVCREIFSILTEATTILGIIALVYTVRQFKRSEMQRNNERIRTEKRTIVE
ncbi:hypothetical protein [Listeria rustica]|uniref:Uncharacterized protein n=1 Tax=Listeria rustica TaxID=2713503 RepID=A0A7W1YH49_9LIST|nr:hypothetical protein [Listeria rustica]MBA3927289.1 hypothetical protein [Listeria rustica]